MSTTGPNQKKSPYHLPGGLTVIISAAAAATAGPPRRDRQPARLPRPLVLSASSSLLRWHRQRSSLSSSTSTSTRVKRAVQGCPAGSRKRRGSPAATTTTTAACTAPPPPSPRGAAAGSVAQRRMTLDPGETKWTAASLSVVPERSCCG
ncbi:hypothetical protein VFPFJ_09987 [Purpureocillium lilacinum]|uniref:Uncharacterized protein n=1 Tax=Purpureocillium lilacinum TaxID=33203 RepID=A0A179GQD3_PURLI|nr:hypothetical protein VFPFJ_09987 [Purpureocillium lilacinum]OAQ79501.1 hypothetical protein VFPFJ_09987 [Purpureocillium lilacinum]